MSNSNIDKFDEITGRLFADLYANFPVPMIIKSENYSVHIEGSDNFVNDVVRDNHECDFVDASVRWLSSSGFITTTGLSNNGFLDVVLTPKGLECLKLTPGSLQPSLGTQLTEAVKAGKTEAVKTFTSQALSVSAALILQGIGLS
ncbi:hypothetical protein ACEPNH_000794 [Citrobacter freundii]|uniref:hypothetical protein n=1 Tax=Citrobacter TaxID=544 RepID=UPI000908065F|nr:MULTISPECIES: hypothetical protein [Citrobacter]EIX7372523.1 hypothetical protein [Citrobacter freundii]EKU2551722.1 hypothetical protein [Citrobacter freundii]MBJ9854551.1 hypothetical protein [Citrobacter freundii]MBM7196304.1 hypothetical protein [Citrobacter freundii]MBM7202894.1 hypothetical protein [Citrobacter freundii]